MIKKISLITLLLLGVLLFSCNTNQAEQPQDVDVDAIRTEAVSTYASLLTETLVAVPTASPTRTAAPSATAGTVTVTTTAETAIPINTCYNLIWLEDRTVPDGTQMKPNEVFTKTWFVQNNGGCAWAPGFTFTNVGGDPMRGETFVFTDPIPVGAKRELSIELVVPSGQNGLIQSSWRMADQNGNFFGDTLSVNIVVGTIATPSSTKTP